MSNIEIDATISWMQGMTAVKFIDVQVWVNGVNRTGTGGNVGFPSTGSQYSFRAYGFQTVQTQYVYSGAEVRLIAKDGAGKPLSMTTRTIQLSP